MASSNKDIAKARAKKMRAAHIRNAHMRAAQIRAAQARTENFRTEKVVIVTGPTFGSAFKFMLFGVAVGAGTIFYWQSKKGPSLPASSEADAVYAGLTAGGAKDSGKAQELVGRLNSLSTRVKSLAGKAKEAAQSAAVTAGPIVADAVTQARSASQEAQTKLHADLQKKPETVEEV